MEQNHNYILVVKSTIIFKRRGPTGAVGNILQKQLQGSKNSNHVRAGRTAKCPLLETQRGKMSNPTALDIAPDLFLAPVATTVQGQLSCWAGFSLLKFRLFKVCPVSQMRNSWDFYLKTFLFCRPSASTVVWGWMP